MNAAIVESFAKAPRYGSFADPVAEAIELHHQAQFDGTPDLALLIAVADALAHALDFSRNEDEVIPPVTQANWTRLGLSAADTELK